MILYITLQRQGNTDKGSIRHQAENDWLGERASGMEANKVTAGIEIEIVFPPLRRNQLAMLKEEK